ncbi:efflux RND transporter periplasmic adaptor subunit [Alteromonas sp. NFXS44]|uniref:efflux RND transporter periplasmic adaptor subunit n=1 Tax=Alteromonas sp. NFXS44 TaxID=2818435 RepID=UPI0032DF5CFD
MQWKKIALPIVILAAGFAGMTLIASAGDKEEEPEIVDTRPTVTISELQAEDYAVTLNSYGEITPLESTMLAAQVSGEVTSWNPDFVPGGLVRRGEILFSIEKDAYEAALLQAEANLSSAQAQLIQEQAQANVAEREAAGMSKSRVTDLYLRKPQLLSAQAAVKSAEAMLRIAKRDLDNCEVRAPYDALIVSREIGTGDYVTPGTVAATLNNVETAEITFPVAGFDQSFLPVSVTSLDATVTVDKRTIPAKLHRDLGIVDQSTRMSHLVARIDDPYGVRSGKALIKFGSFANISFNGKTLENVFRIPQELVNNKRIWLVSEDATLQSEIVEIVREQDDFYFVRGNFDGLQLVTSPPEYPLNGMAVKVIEQSNKLVAAHANSTSAGI